MSNSIFVVVITLNSDYKTVEYKDKERALKLARSFQITTDLHVEVYETYKSETRGNLPPKSWLNIPFDSFRD